MSTPVFDSLTIGFPPAVLGFALGPEGGFAVRVCAWHAPEAKRRAEAWANGLPITHTICLECKVKMDAELLGEKIEA